MPEFNNDILNDDLNVVDSDAVMRKAVSALGALKRSMARLASLYKVLPDQTCDFQEVDWPRVCDGLAAVAEQHWADAKSLYEDSVGRIASLRAAVGTSLAKGLAAQAAAHGWAIQGAWPEPVVNEIVFLRFDADSGRLSMNGRTLKAITIKEVVGLIEGEIQTLTPKNFDPGQWVNRLGEVYDAVRRKHAIADGDPVPIFDLIPEMALAQQSPKFVRDPIDAHFSSYGVARFRADLTRVLRAEKTVLDDGRHIRLTASSFARDNFLMYFPATRHLGSCGRIGFQRLLDNERTTV